MKTLRLLTLALAAIVPPASAQDRPVKIVADHTIRLVTPDGPPLLPLYLSLNGSPVDLSHPLPAVTRAVILIHGRQRNADTYNNSGLEAIRLAGPAASGTLLITPQFLEEVDIDTHRLSPEFLRWAPETWIDGATADGAPLSSFAVIDALLKQLGSAPMFPNLRSIVLAGHSAGGQFVQRYSVAGRAPDALPNRIHLRFVAANPSSYVYFSPERPTINKTPRPGGNFSFAVPQNTCRETWNHWKYGLQDLPTYLASANPAELESRYLTRDVIYLLGTADTDPRDPDIDKSCSGELEGPYRLVRGEAYVSYLRQRHPDFTHKLWLVPGVAHSGERMLTSDCGLAALFDAGACSTDLVPLTP